MENIFYTSKILYETDNTITLSLNEIDLIVNAENLEKAKTMMAKEILDYAEDYNKEYELWSKASNRKSHVPYVLKALVLNNINDIKDIIKTFDL